MKLELTGYRRWRGSIQGFVRVLGDDGAILFADSVNLESAKARAGFIADLDGRLNGTRPAGADFERDLLRLLAQAEAALRDDPAPAAPSPSAGEERIEAYRKRSSGYGLIHVEDGARGPTERFVPLSNFTAEIVEDLTLDDGAERRKYFVLSGQLAGRPLPLVRVLASQFFHLGWVVEHWGVGARVMPGQGRRDQLRDCIQAFSDGATARTIFGHTGWRQVAGLWLYLHGAGGIGADGPIAGVEVELAGKLVNYRLPSPPTGDTLKLAVRASWDLWAVAKPVAAATFQGAAYGAPLAEFLRPDFSLWAYGHTGKLKTSYLALQTAHFGEWDVKSTPGNWESTANSLEKQTFVVKDALFLIDDFRPPADRNEAAEMRRKAARLVRAAGNRGGRGRMAADTTLRPEYFPRGIVVSTAEERISGESAAARRWEIEFVEVTVDFDRLKEAAAQTDGLRQAMAGYVSWLAGRLDADTSWPRALYQQAREAAKAVGGHLRHPSTLAYLLTSWSIFAEFAQEIGAVTADEALERLQQVDGALRAVAANQAEEAARVKPEIIFLETLGDLIAGGKAFLVTTGGDAPPDAESWGWQAWTAEGINGPETQTKPVGDKLGWVDDEMIYLIPSLAHRLVSKTVGDRGDSFIISERALHQALERGGFLAPGTKGLRHALWAENLTRNTIRLKRKAVQAIWGAAQ